MGLPTFAEGWRRSVHPAAAIGRHPRTLRLRIIEHRQICGVSSVAFTLCSHAPPGKFSSARQLRRTAEALELLLRQAQCRRPLLSGGQMSADLEVGPADLIAQTESIAE